MYAFAGNSFLAPMTAATSPGLSPGFWKTLPTFGATDVDNAAKELAAFALHIKDSNDDKANAVQACAVEYTHLFIGPPRPAAAPWETMYAPGNNTIGYGSATVEMKRIIAAQGLQLQGLHNQYEDHIGVELLLLSVLCAKQHEAACAIACSQEGEAACPKEHIRDYLLKHPGNWIEHFTANVIEAAPGSYYALLATWVQALILWHLDQA